LLAAELLPSVVMFSHVVVAFFFPPVSMLMLIRHGCTLGTPRRNHVHRGVREADDRSSEELTGRWTGGRAFSAEAICADMYYVSIVYRRHDYIQTALGRSKSPPDPALVVRLLCNCIFVSTVPPRLGAVCIGTWYSMPSCQVANLFYIPRTHPTTNNQSFASLTHWRPTHRYSATTRFETTPCPTYSMSHVGTACNPVRSRGYIGTYFTVMQPNHKPRGFACQECKGMDDGWVLEVVLLLKYGEGRWMGGWRWCLRIGWKKGYLTPLGRHT
jgi:hypothetical protein